MVVGPGISAAASSAFSVPITEGSSMKILVARGRPGVRYFDPALVTDPSAEVPESVQVRVQAPATDRVPAGRGHLRLAEARQQRARGEE